MEWCKIDSEYLDYLRKVDNRVPYNEYGEQHYKPFFHKLFDLDEDIEYVCCITSSKSKMMGFKDRSDFKKIFLEVGSGRQFLAGAVYLSDMIPVPKKVITTVRYRDIQNFRSFRNDDEKSKYIFFLRKEMSKLEEMRIDEKGEKLYKNIINHPNSPLAKRSFDFIKLNKAAKEYKKYK